MKIQYPEDVIVIRKYLERFQNTTLTDTDIDYLWSQFSTEMFAAGWIVVDTKTLELFEKYLKNKGI